MSGGNTITYTDMKNYMDITGNTIGAKEATIITRLDREYLKIMNKD